MNIVTPITTSLNSNFAAVTQPGSGSPHSPEPFMIEGFELSFSWDGLLSGVSLTGEVASSCNSVVDGSSPAPKGTNIDLGLSKMDLRRRYPKEANAHRAMLARCSNGARVHSSFKKFASFLQHVGPMPARNCTLDRIDNADPEYSPGKVRWADRHTQNNNKGDTLTFRHSRTGDVYTTSRLAALQQVSPAAIRKRRAEGWIDDEIVEGKRAAAARPISTTSRKQQDTPSIFPVVQRRQSAAEIQFHRDRTFCEAYREEHGDEYFIANPHEVAVIANEGRELPIVLRTDLDALWSSFLTVKLPNWWRQYKPHIVFDRLSPEDQALIAYIDPKYVLSRADHGGRLTCH